MNPQSPPLILYKQSTVGITSKVSLGISYAILLLAIYQFHDLHWVTKVLSYLILGFGILSATGLIFQMFNERKLFNNIPNQSIGEVKEGKAHFLGQFIVGEGRNNRLTSFFGTPFVLVNHKLNTFNRNGTRTVFEKIQKADSIYLGEKDGPHTIFIPSVYIDFEAHAFVQELKTRDLSSYGTILPAEFLSKNYPYLLHEKGIPQGMDVQVIGDVIEVQDNEQLSKAVHRADPESAWRIKDATLNTMDEEWLCHLNNKPQSKKALIPLKGQDHFLMEWVQANSSKASLPSKLISPLFYAVSSALLMYLLLTA